MNLNEKTQDDAKAKLELKILLLGDHDTGKTCLIKSFYELKDFEEENLSPSIFKFYPKVISFRNTKLLINTIDTSRFYSILQLRIHLNFIIFNFFAKI